MLYFLQDALIIGSRLDADQDSSACRLAFYGRLASLINPDDPTELQKLQIYKVKQKVGTVDRVAQDGKTVICRGMFKKETDISLFNGMKVRATVQ